MKHESRLGFLITDLSGGGAERVVSNLARGLTDHRRELFLFRDLQAYPFEGAIHVLDLPLFSEEAFFRVTPVRTARGLWRLSRIKRESRVDRCISFLTWPNLFNILTRAEEQVIISVRNNPSRAVRGPISPVIKGLMRRMYPRADHVVAISEDVRRDLIENFRLPPDRVTTIYNPIRLDEISELTGAPAPPSLASLPPAPTVITAGRLTMQKGQWHLIRAFTAVKTIHPEARLLILGVGPLRERLISLARELGFRVWVQAGSDPSAGHAEIPPETDVIFWGFSDNPFPLLARADVFAFPSLWEGLGNVLIESMAIGLPVVAADCHSGPREVLTGRLEPRESHRPEWAAYGILAPVCDGVFRGAKEPLRYEEIQWAEVLSELLEDGGARRRYGQQGRLRARDFDLDRITGQWRQLLRSLDSGRRQ
jgi:glycosyltransferase involved in cell wall biosynthesis